MRMFSTCSPPNTALRNCTNGTCYLLTPGGNRQLYHRLHQIQAKTSNKTKYKNSTASVPTPPLLRLEVHFSSKTVLRGHRHVLGHAPALGTPHVWHLRPPRGGQKRPTGLGGTSAPLSAAPAPPPGGAVPEGRLPPPGPPHRRCQSGPGPRGASGRAGPGGRRTESHLLRRCPAGGLRLYPALPVPVGYPAPAIAAAASQGSAGLLAGTSRRSQARWVWKPVTTCQDGVAPKPAAEAGRELVWTGEARPSLAQSAGQRLPRGAAGPPAFPCPALLCPALPCAALPAGRTCERGWPHGRRKAGDNADTAPWAGEKRTPQPRLAVSSLTAGRKTRQGSDICLYRAR